MCFVRTVETTHGGELLYYRIHIKRENTVFDLKINETSCFKTDIPVFCVIGAHRLNQHDHLKNKIKNKTYLQKGAFP
jgi:hypothetical protein